MLILALAVVMGVVRGGWFVVGLPLTVVAAWAGYAWLGLWRRLPLRTDAQQIEDTAQAEFARKLTHGLSTPAAVISDGLITCVNLAWLDFFDRAKPDDQLLGTPFTNLVHPQDRQRFVALTRSAAEQRQTGAVSVRMMRPDATEFACEISALQFDVTLGMMLLQFNLPDGGQLLRSGADHHLEGLLGGLEQAVFQIDAAGRCVYLSRAWEGLSGFSVSETATRPLADFFHPNDRPDVEAALKRVASGRGEPLLAEVRLLSGAGTLHWVELRASPCLLDRECV